MAYTCPNLIFPILKQRDSGAKSRLIDSNEETNLVEEMAKEADRLNKNVDKTMLGNIATSYIRARNTKYLLQTMPEKAFAPVGNNGHSTEIGGKSYGINSNLLVAWAMNNKIAGIEFDVISVNAGGKIRVVQIINAPQVLTERNYGEYMQSMMKLEGIGKSRFSNIFNKDVDEFIRTANGEELVEFVSQDKACQELYNKSAKLWEGWTVGQHTASVIDFFNRYYADALPENLHSVMKLAILAHDIGKGVTEKGGDHHKTSLKLVDNLFKSLNVERKFGKVDIQRIVKFIIGKSQMYTSQILLQEQKDEKDKAFYDKSLIGNFNYDCKSILTQAFGGTPTKDEIDLLRNMCLILQFCDSGAYTYYAKVKEGNKYVSGGNARFTKSFELTGKGTPVLKRAEDLGLILTKAKPEINVSGKAFQDAQNNNEITNPLRIL